MVRKVKEMPFGRRQFGWRGRRPFLELNTSGSLTGVRLEVVKIVNNVPVDSETGAVSRSAILSALRKNGFRVRTSTQGIDVMRLRDKRRTFFKYAKRPLG